MRLVTHLLAVVLALFVASYIVPGISVDSFYTACVVAVLLGLLNLLVRPVLMVLTLPITIITMGLFVFVLNAGLFWFVGTFVEGFVVSGFIPALFGSLVVSVASWLVGKK
ncbi:MAG: phage holin family protein [Candidatus Pacebacteria bacterium]|nr:phage holin family protein [Candidatus Paceibacterota bacterium]